MKRKYVLFTAIWLVVLCHISTFSNAQQPFITTWQIFDADESITINTAKRDDYSYTVDWGDSTTDDVVYEGAATHVYTEAGTYQVSISGTLPRFSIDTESKTRIRSIDQWGDNNWSTMDSAFYNCRNMTYAALDTPDLTKVISVSSMFSLATSFNGDLSEWDVSNVTNMSRMFRSTRLFNSDLSDWDVSNVTDMSYMFSGTELYNSDLSNWDVSNVTDMSGLFSGAISFDNDLYWWDVSNVTDMSYMFSTAYSFDQNIYAWDVSNVTDMSYMFNGVFSFDQNISGWDVSNVSDMSYMFYNTRSFNQNLSAWDVSNVTDMEKMFYRGDNFNGDLSGWDVSSVTDMRFMFADTRLFNSDLSDWDVSNVTNMMSMFSSAISFDSDLSGWDVSNVTHMRGLFSSAISFDSDLSGWDVSNVTDMRGLFLGAISFNSDLSGWDISNVTDMSLMFDGCRMSFSNYDNTLLGWSTLNEGENQIPDGLELGADGIEFCYESGRVTLIEGHGWLIIGDTKGLCRLEEVADQEMLANEETSFTVVVKDGEGTLTFSLDGMSIEKGMVIDASTGVFTWSPNNSQARDHQVTVTLSNGSLSDHNDFTITVMSVLGLYTIDELCLAVYPNPTVDKLTFQLEDDYYGPMNIRVVNLSSSTVYEASYQKQAASFEQSIDMSGFQSGIYLLQVVRPNQELFTYKLYKR
ncbi:MAG: BspA family leucine-rich repeat surface protein [Reichenbachiella sp.]